MSDLHCHILPGVDDGSADEEESCLPPCACGG